VRAITTSCGGALQSAFSGLSDVGADRPFAGMAFDKMRSASAKPAARQAPWGSTHVNTLGLKTFLGRSTRTGSRGCPRVSAHLAINLLSRSKDRIFLMRLPSGSGCACAPSAATPLWLTRMGTAGSFRVAGRGGGGLTDDQFRREHFSLCAAAPAKPLQH
jgi:hypothetical protein